MYSEETIEKLADLVRTSFELAPPYKPIPLAENLGGDVVKNDTTVIDASVKKHGAEGFIINLNPEKYRSDDAQERFTVAHELGHLFLHMGFLINKKLWESINEETYMAYKSEASPKHKTREELEADVFAFAFLMPKKEFKQQISRNRSDDDDTVNINNIAKHFEVSPKMVLTRAKRLGYVEW